MEEIVTSRFPEVTVKKVDKAVSKGYFKSRSEALRIITEDYLKEHPELFLGDKLGELIDKAPALSDSDLEKLATSLFKGSSVTTLVGEGR